MSKLYFGVCPYGTIADVFINTLAGWSDEWLQPCTPAISTTGHLVHNEHQDYVLKLSNNQPMTFRDIDYTNRLKDIEKVLETADEKKVWIGNFSSKQARLVKKHFGDDVTTLGLCYKANMHNIVLDTILGYYEQDISKEEYFVRTQSKYYADKAMFDKLVPVNFSPDCDVDIDLGILFNPDNFITQLEILDGPRNKKQLEYYFTWLYKTKERLNEG